MLQLIEMSEIISPIQAPLPNSQTAGLSLDYLSVIEEAVENLPEEDDWHEDEVHTAQDKNMRFQGVSKLLPSVNSLIILPKVPLIEWCPGRFEEDKFQVKSETSAEK